MKSPIWKKLRFRTHSSVALSSSPVLNMKAEKMIERKTYKACGKKTWSFVWLKIGSLAAQYYLLSVKPVLPECYAFHLHFLYTRPVFSYYIQILN